jgi:Brp/Blh family beta-carotene 15,15'-monooxygenase
LTWQAYILVTLVILAGLPHGALDPLVAHKAGIWTTASGFGTFIAAYIALAFLALLGWLALPGLALLVFLLYSGYHFSGDWRGTLHPVVRISCGLFLVSAPAFFHPDQTWGYFAILAGESAANLALPIMQAIALPTIAGMGVATFQTRMRWGVCVEFPVLMAAAILLEPLLFFIQAFQKVLKNNQGDVVSISHRRIGIHRSRYFETFAYATLPGPDFMKRPLGSPGLGINSNAVYAGVC